MERLVSKWLRHACVMNPITLIQPMSEISPKLGDGHCPCCLVTCWARISQVEKVLPEHQQRLISMEQWELDSGHDAYRRWLNSTHPCRHQQQWDQTFSGHEMCRDETITHSVWVTPLFSYNMETGWTQGCVPPPRKPSFQGQQPEATGETGLHLH